MRRSVSPGEATSVDFSFTPLFVEPDQSSSVIVLRSLVSSEQTGTPAAGGGAVDALAAMDVLLAHRAEFVAFVAARVEDRGAAEDLVQEALVRAMDGVKTLRAGDALLGWFYRVLRNAITDHHRRRGASARAMERLAEEPENADVEPASVCRCVTHLAQELKPEYEVALRRVEVDGTPVKELAEELGITAGNAAVRVHRAREALRKKVATYCKACAEAGCTDCTCGHGA